MSTQYVTACIAICIQNSKNAEAYSKLVLMCIYYWHKSCAGATRSCFFFTS